MEMAVDRQTLVKLLTMDNKNEIFSLYLFVFRSLNRNFTSLCSLKLLTLGKNQINICFFTHLIVTLQAN